MDTDDAKGGPEQKDGDGTGPSSAPAILLRELVSVQLLKGLSDPSIDIRTT